jgi:bla regulator protein blaR1
LAFEVASVREDPSGKYLTPPFSVDSDNGFADTGGLFTADAPLTTYISFAYKLDQQHNMLAHLPQWASTKHFEMHARAAGHPSKDQMRLMMQTLLADRFKLSIHFETQELPVMMLTLAKPGTLGPRLRLHADGPPCDVVAPRPPNAALTFDMFPCTGYLAVDEPDHRLLAGARDTTVQLMAAFFTNVGHMRPIVDRTGIRGNIDFSMEYTPEARGAPGLGADAPADVVGATFLDAVKEQLGLRLEPAKAPLKIPVVDHVEMPSEN